MRHGTTKSETDDKPQRKDPLFDGDYKAFRRAYKAWHERQRYKKKHGGRNTPTDADAKRQAAPQQQLGTSAIPTTDPAVSHHLYLHFDINETILMGDPAGGDTFDDCLQKTLAKSAFVKADADEWHDGTPLHKGASRSRRSPPPLLDPFRPPPGCVSYYKKYRAAAKRFTAAGSPGVVYAPMLERLKSALRYPTWAPECPELSQLGDDGERYHLVLPAFFRTLEGLVAAGRSFSVVLRTMGTDAPRVQAALEAYATGKHPIFAKPTFAVDLRLSDWSSWRGRYTESGRFEMRLRADSVETVLDESRAVHELHSGRSCISAVQDDYEWWRSHGCAPGSGKPLWLTLSDHGFPLFFDDNIHNDGANSIVSCRVRAKNDAPFVTVPGDMVRRLHGSCLRKVPTWMPALDDAWFLDEIARCERSFHELRAGSLWRELGELVGDRAGAGGGAAEAAAAPTSSTPHSVAVLSVTAERVTNTEGELKADSTGPS